LAVASTRAQPHRLNTDRAAHRQQRGLDPDPLRVRDD